MGKFKIFIVIAVMVLISSGVFNACQKENVIQNEEDLIKQQKSASYFVLMTEAERQYLLESGESMTIDEFTSRVWEVVNTFTNVADMIFVASVRDYHVIFAGISGDGDYKLWYNRLNEHIYEHIDGYNSDNTPVACLYTDDDEKIGKWIAKQLNDERDFEVKYIALSKKYIFLKKSAKYFVSLQSKM